MGFGTLFKLVFSICLYQLYTMYRARRLPPGISGLQCLLAVPKEKPWVKMLELTQKYGDIASQSFLGYNMIIVSSARIASDLLEKRGTNYNDRPRSVMGGELSGWGKMMVLCDYNNWFRSQRKWIAHDIGSHATVEKLHRMIEGETRRTLRSALAEPDRIRAHLRKNFTSVVLRLSHGYITREGDDPLVDLAEVANSQLSKATVYGGNFVDFLPVLKYIPSWFPGAGFKKRAKENTAVLHDLLEIPHNHVMSQLTAGTAIPSLSSRLLSMPDLTEDLVDNIKWTALTMYRAGADTSSAVTYAFYLAMTLYPDVMKKAQRELDSVVGTNRLPTFADRPSLPYVEALFTEILRWHVPIPFTMRRATADDEQDGYFIPAGSYVIVNIWALLRDERTYQDPLEFKPERFLGNDPETHPSNVCFGLARRRCPGHFLVNSTVWLMCVQSLAVFDISKHVENGVEVTPEVNQVGGLIVHMAPFKCAIKPRSAAAKDLVKEELVI
ncbi:cytochrome P450 [Boletus edulis]|nr:cytochrome P450 [Boletus edulis]